MLETIFRGIFDTELTATITLREFLLCVGVSFHWPSAYSCA